MQFNWDILKPQRELTDFQVSLVREIATNFLTQGAPTPDHEMRVKLGKNRKVLGELNQLGLTRAFSSLHCPAFPALFFLSPSLRDPYAHTLDLIFTALKELYSERPNVYPIQTIENRAASAGRRPTPPAIVPWASVFLYDFTYFCHVGSGNPEYPVKDISGNDNILDYEDLQSAWALDLAARPRAELYPPPSSAPDTPKLNSAENVRHGVTASISVNAEVTARRERIEAAARALSDKPSIVDLLEFDDYAQALTDLVENPNTQRPMTVAIDGAWGSGKTTLMRMMKERLDADRSGGGNGRAAHTVWFNAWKHDQEDSLWAALALEILFQVRSQLRPRQRALLWFTLNWKRLDGQKLLADLAKFLLLPLAATLAAILFVHAWHHWVDGSIDLAKWKALVAGGGALTTLSLLLKRIHDAVIAPFDLNISKYVRAPQYKERLGFLHEFGSDFKCVVDVVTRGGKASVAIFIDDLDRCEPGKPVEVIEAINQLLDADFCVFVLGMDAHNVAASVQAKYKAIGECAGNAENHAATIGYQFLEKIVQIPFRLPKTNQRLLTRLVDWNLDPQESQQFQKQAAVSEAEQLITVAEQTGKPLEEAAASVQQSRPDLPQEAVAEARRNVFARTFDDDEEVRRAIYKVVPFLEQNPRRVKRFINIFRLNVLIANRRGLLETGTVEVGRLAKWLAIAVRWPDFVDLLSDRSFFNRLLDAHELRAKSFGTSHLTNAEAARTRLGPYLDDPRIKRFVDEGELFALLSSLQGKQIHIEALADSLLPYVELSAVTSALPPK